jgi:4'-phosphopantetheinyl transferase EntD
VGVDVEEPSARVIRIQDKYLSDKEKRIFKIQSGSAEISDFGIPTPYSQLHTILWSAKESVFKWYGYGGVDFRQHIRLFNPQEEKQTIDCFFARNESELVIHYRQFEELVMAWVVS